ncbi:cobalamin-independent methionine synthase II family protein [Dinghuibacter silviterrae]|uniref:5-methyltetrahydropteroyltriglutamate--homocysteine methyltransferase n=1 Tax=Dinghuibacter silviterrae TaxID=1539049 RepID=A0A4R8DIN7_9BACT|nr:cobalamin-independent methionine synthase II family protein [Dinghuibacter silviterrae]TDW97427.1 5-methyltetrahydropteroyltriglutamate--homocysteine methyltransferase [Dinghuibacter silviterrae]
MRIPTEPVGSIPRPAVLLEGMHAHASGLIDDKELDRLFESALKDTLRQLEATGSPVLSDGEQTKPSFATYPIAGLPGLNPNGVVISFADGHQRQLPALTGGPFRYRTYASSYLEKARRFSGMPIKQAVISVSALSLLYPQEGIEGYDRAQFLEDLAGEAETDIRRCLDRAAHVVQVDFTEGRLALKLDPSGALLQSFIDLNNQVLSRFTEEERRRIGIHSCPGGDHDSTHSADVPYGALLPYLFQLQAGNFYLEYAAEPDKPSVLASIKKHARPSARIFLGVTNVLNPRVETPEEVRDLILEAAAVLPARQLGTTDDCGFSPFADDTSTSRAIAFAKIQARVRGTWLAEGVL